MDGGGWSILAIYRWLHRRGKRDRACISSRVDTTWGQPGQLQDALNRAMGMITLMVGVKKFGCLV
jgi:hypothetical protein